MRKQLGKTDPEAAIILLLGAVVFAILSIPVFMGTGTEILHIPV